MDATDRSRIAEDNDGRAFRAAPHLGLTVKWRAVQPKATAMR